MNVTGVGQSSTSTSAETAAPPPNPNGLGKDDFLKLLVAQISNQSPLNPMDNTEFVAQLAQFSNLEQLAQVNKRLDALALGQAGLLTGQSVQLLGKKVVYSGSDMFLADGSASYRYDLGRAAAEVEVTIKDESGRVVRTLTTGAQSAGKQEGVWNGLDDDGNAVAPGRYTIEVKATDGNGDDVTVQTYGIGVVSGISFDKGYPELLIGTARIQSANIVEVTG